jgi:hypothetical protein
MVRRGVAILIWWMNQPRFESFGFTPSGRAGKKDLALLPALMEWYYSQNSTQHGPVSDVQLRGKLMSGEVAASELVWREGMRDWAMASSVPELSSSVRIPAVGESGMPPASPSGASPASPYAPPSGQLPYTAPPPTSALAIASLICGILGLVTCLFIPGIPAVICGHMALNRMAVPGVNLQGRELAIAGLIMGYIGVVVCSLFVLIFLLAAFGASI